MKKSIAGEKSFAFALRIIKLAQYLQNKKREKVLSGQILRSGTSIGANIEEASGAQSNRDFFAKISIAYKEARETSYWLRLLKESGYIDEKAFNSMFSDCEELLKIIGSIQKSMKEKIN
jgi:four helix bundle protein